MPSRRFMGSGISPSLLERMQQGELITRTTIWVALGLATAVALVAMRGHRAASMHLRRCLWTTACLAYMAHVIAAFHFFHHWSHADAYAATARQTAEVTGWNWGGGLYANHAFTALWMADVVWWWAIPDSHAKRPQWLNRLWEGFFLFIAFNATVVFGHGPVQWAGAVVFCWLIFAWLQARERRTGGVT